MPTLTRLVIAGWLVLSMQAPAADTPGSFLLERFKQTDGRLEPVAVKANLQTVAQDIGTFLGAEMPIGAAVLDRWAAEDVDAADSDFPLRSSPTEQKFEVLRATAPEASEAVTHFTWVFLR